MCGGFLHTYGRKRSLGNRKVGALCRGLEEVDRHTTNLDVLSTMRLKVFGEIHAILGVIKLVMHNKEWILVVEIDLVFLGHGRLEMVTECGGRVERRKTKKGVLARLTRT